MGLASQEMDQAQSGFDLGGKVDSRRHFRLGFRKAAAFQQQSGIQQKLEKSRKVILVNIRELVQLSHQPLGQGEIPLVQLGERMPVEVQGNKIDFAEIQVFLHQFFVVAFDRRPVPRQVMVQSGGKIIDDMRFDIVSFDFGADKGQDFVADPERKPAKRKERAGTDKQAVAGVKMRQIEAGDLPIEMQRFDKVPLGVDNPQRFQFLVEQIKGLQVLLGRKPSEFQQGQP